MLVIWDVQSGKAVCGNPVGMNTANKVRFYNNSNNKLLTVHNYGIRLWTSDMVGKKIQANDVNLG